MQQRKRWSEEFKREVVGLSQQPGANLSQIDRDEEVMALKCELERVKKERDFLRHAAAFFAKESP